MTSLAGAGKSRQQREAAAAYTEAGFRVIARPSRISSAAVLEINAEFCSNQLILGGRVCCARR